VVDEAVYRGGDRSVCGRLKKKFFVWDGWPPAASVSTFDSALIRVCFTSSGESRIPNHGRIKHLRSGSVSPIRPRITSRFGGVNAPIHAKICPIRGSAGRSMARPRTRIGQNNVTARARRQRYSNGVCLLSL
jgi:hypothetical protein